MTHQRILSRVYVTKGNVGQENLKAAIELSERLSRIERLSQQDAWTPRMYLEEFNSPHAVLIFVITNDGNTKERESLIQPELIRALPEPGLIGSNTIAGFCCVRTLFEVSELRNIIVHPDYRGRGIGTALLQVAITEAISSGAEELTLEVRESNVRARHIYEKLSFEESGKRPGYYRNNNEAAIIMTKNLHPINSQ